MRPHLTLYSFRFIDTVNESKSTRLFISHEYFVVMPINTSAKKKKNPAAVALGKLGASKGGIARAKKLSPARRKEIARKAIAARWGRSKKG